MSHRSTLTRRRSAFTLVELLVVIGIIAILVALLLPALQAARRQAATVTCAAHLRELGNAFGMYAHESNGYFPPASFQIQTGAPAGMIYNIDGFDYKLNVPALWDSFIAKYVTKTKQGVSSNSNESAADAKRTVIWGCPAWGGQRSVALGEFNRNFVGYGMNPYPVFTATSPTWIAPEAAATAYEQPHSPVRALIRWNSGGQNGNFLKRTRWTQPSQRMLMADSWNWRVKSRPKPTNGVFPEQPIPNETLAFSDNAPLDQTLVDVFRHGKVPGSTGVRPRSYSKTGGKVAYNVLYADGHVVTEVTQDAAYDSIRFGNPGGIRSP